MSNLQSSAVRRRGVLGAASMVVLLVLASVVPTGAEASVSSGGTWPPPKPEYDTPFAVERINEAADGTSANANTWRATLSGDGSVSAFITQATNLHPEPDGGSEQIFVQSATGVRTPLRAIDVVYPPEDSGEPFEWPRAVFGWEVSLDHDGSTAAVSTSTWDVDNVEHHGVEVVDVATGTAKFYEAPGQTAAPALSADGNTVAFLSDVGTEGTPSWKLMVARSSDAQPTEVADLGSASQPPIALSPDGTRLAYYRWDMVDGVGTWSAWLVDDLADPSPRPLGTIDTGPEYMSYGGPSFSGDSKVLATVDETVYPSTVRLRGPGGVENLEVFDGDGSAPRLVGTVRDLALDDDGSTVAFSMTEADATAVSIHVWLYDRGLDRLSLASAAEGVAGDGHSYDVSISADGHTVLFLSDAGNLDDGDSRIPEETAFTDVYLGVRPPLDLSAPPSWESGAELVVDEVREDAVDLSWTAATDDEGVVAYQVLLDGSIRQEIPVSDPAGPITATLTGLRGDTPYRVGVRALDADRQRTPVLEVDVRTSPPSAAWMTASATGPNTVEIDWSAPMDGLTGTGYRIHRTGGGADATFDVGGGLETTTYTDTPVASSTTYEYSLLRVVDGTTVPYAGPVTVQTPASAVPLVAQAAERGSVQLSWAPDPAGAEGYRILRGPSRFDLTGIAEVGDVTEHVDDTVEMGVAYYYRVESLRDGVAHQYTSEAWVTARSGAHLSAWESSGDVVLSWSEATEDGYRLERSVAGRDWELLAELGPEATGHRDEGVPSSTEVSYRLLERRSDGSTVPFSNTFTIATSALTAPSGRVVTQTTAWDVVRLGSTIVVEATGSAGRQAEAEIAYTSWYAGGSTELADEPVERTETVPLEAVAPSGSYRGSFSIPAGAAEIRSVVVELSDGADATARSDELLGAPLQVSGGVHVTMTEGEGFSRLSAASSGGWQAYVEPFEGREAEVLTLTPGREWYLTMAHDSGHLVADRVITPRPGLVEELEIDPVLPAAVTLTVRWPAGRPDAFIVGTLSAPNGRTIGQAVPIDPPPSEGTDTFAFGPLLSEGTEVHPGVQISTYPSQDTITGAFTAYPRIFRVATPTALPAGATELVVDVQPLPQGSVVGRLTETGRGPLAGAMIHASQTVDGRSWSYRATTGDDGSFDMPVLAGRVRVTAVLPGDLAPVVLAETTIDADDAVDVTREFAPLRTYTIVPTLESRRAGEVEGVVQDITQWQIRSRWPVWLDRAGHRANYPGPDWTVTARPGTTGRMCGAEGSTQGLASCVDVDFDDETTIAARVVVVESTQVVATITYPEGVPAQWVHGALHDAGDGQDVLIRYLSGREVLKGRAGPGEYELVVEAAGYRGRASLTITGGEEQVELDVLMSPTQDWTFTEASGITANPAVVSSGGLVDLRVAARLAEGLDPLGRPTIAIALPDGLTVRGVQVDGTPVAEDDLPQPVRGELLVPLGGAVDASAERVLRVQAATPPSLVGRVPITATLRADDDGEATERPLGGTSVEVGVFTFEAPSTATSPQVWLSGRGPVGATVDLYANDQLLGSVDSIPLGGRWRTQVTLPATDVRATFDLHAVARSDELEQRSDTRQVTVDRSEPRMTRVQVYQDGGRLVEFDPADGVARFPYVFNPHQKTYVRLHFEQPDRVDNVRIRVVDTEVVAEPQSDGWFQAVLETAKFGRITTRFDVAAPPVGSLDDVELPSLEEVERLTPALFDDAIRTTPDDGPSNSASFVLPNLSSAACREAATPTLADGCVQMTMTVDADGSVPYSPTEEDLRVERLSGYQASDPTFEVRADGGKISIEVSAGMSDAFLPPETEEPMASSVGEVAGLDASSPQLFMASALAAARSGGGRGRIKIDIEGLKEKYETAEEVYEQIKDVVDGFDHLEQMIDRIDYIRRWAAKCPSNEITSDIPADMDVVQDRIRVAQIADAGNRIFFAKAPLGVGSALYSKVGEVMSKSWSVGFGRHLDRAEAMLRAADCDPPPDDGGGSSTTGAGGSGGDDGGGGDGDGDGGSPGGSPIADPTPIYDPSGYVYEGMHSNRIEGVTATVMQSEARNTEDPTGSQWNTWAAEWFGQENPLITDPNGRYGWDVPEGWWQVLFTASGYQPARSAELRVLPPHFDVNIGMTSLVPAAIAGATATAGVPGRIELTFDRPIQVGSVVDPGADNVVVRRGAEVIPGTWTSVAAEPDPAHDGGQLAMVFRFTPAEPLVQGEVLEVSTAVGVRDYADRPMAAGDLRDVAVAAGTPTDPGTGDPGGGQPGGGGGGGGSVPGSGVTFSAPAGSGPVTLTVDTPLGPALVELRGIRSGGTLSITPDDGATRRGFRLLDTWYEVSVDVPFESASLCLPYDDAELASAGVERTQLSLLHGRSDGGVEDVTTHLERGRVCGTTTSFSPFYLGSPATERRAGPDRYATAAAISRATFEPGVDVAYVVTGSAFADGLVGGPVAARLRGPILLAGPTGVTAGTLDELHRLRPQRIVVLGGTAAVSDDVLAQLHSVTDDVERMAGRDRYATAAALAEATFDRVDTVYVATGERFPDALVGGAAATGDGAPLLLVPGGDVPDSVLSALRSLAARRVVVVGGTSAIPDAVAGQLAAVSGASVTRLAGSDRYGTAAAVAAGAGAGGPVVVASGESFADALAGLPLAGAERAPLVLVRPHEVPDVVREQLDELRSSRLILLGGTVAVDRATELVLAGTMAG